MKAVLRIALGFFSALPLQRALNIIGGVLMTLGAAWALTDWSSINLRHAASLPFLLGATFITLTPGVFGGAILRGASTRVLLHQLPHGRSKLLLGATLTMTMVAMLLTLAVLPAMPGDLHGWTALDVFACAWSIAVLVWIAVFIGSASPVQVVLIWLAAYPIGKLREIGLTVAVPGAPVLLFAALTWAAFCIWYMAVRTIDRTPWRDRPRSLPKFDRSPVVRLLSRIFSKDHDAATLSGTRVYLIGTPGLIDYAIGSVAPLLGFMFMAFLLRRTHPDVALVPPVVLPILTMTCATIGITTTRRARLLWLRAGVDRMGLFTLAEQQGLRVGMVTLAAGTVAYLVISLAAQPAYALPLFVFALSQLAFGVCMFYGGLSLTRGWELAEALPGLSLLLLTEVVATTTATLFPPSLDVANVASSAALLLFVLLAPLLRWQARRRWRALDWRIARPSPGGLAAATDTRRSP